MTLPLSLLVYECKSQRVRISFILYNKLLDGFITKLRAAYGGVGTIVTLCPTLEEFSLNKSLFDTKIDQFFKALHTDIDIRGDPPGTT